MKEQIDRYKKTNEIIAKFPNGAERFRESPVFNRVVQMLVRDADPLEIIDVLITNAEDTGKALEHHLMHCPPAPNLVTLTQ